MQVFHCPTCDRPLYLHNTACRCGQPVQFDPDAQAMRIDATPCRNRERISCNWMAEDDAGWCRSCAMTRTVPDMGTDENLQLWVQTEMAKRWMLAGLARWGWFGPSDTGDRPSFRMLSEQTSYGGARVVMGHANGLITINVTEASEAERTRRRENMGELYRTMLGHMRHEMAHFLHLRLSSDPAFLTGFRDLFGDERADYGEALKKHYAAPAPTDNSHVTSYATAHPHEDWAETIAHLLHLTDLLDSAAAAELSIPNGYEPGYDAYAEEDPHRLLRLAVDVSIRANHVNRAMDLPDLYPFVLTGPVREKLSFAHGHLRRT